MVVCLCACMRAGVFALQHNTLLRFDHPCILTITRASSRMDKGAQGSACAKQRNCDFAWNTSHAINTCLPVLTDKLTLCSPFLVQAMDLLWGLRILGIALPFPVAVAVQVRVLGGVGRHEEGLIMPRSLQERHALQGVTHCHTALALPAS